ncbi:MFS transporter [Geminicoccus harenae]|uniref:MFS transporter n=2 Tax=Geminicoccus harenae TaxID=2498453 RepID=UPI001C96CEAF|nr:MFS transporter [Geminicoccus harenae]
MSSRSIEQPAGGRGRLTLLGIGVVILAASIFGLVYGLTAPLIAGDLAALGHGEFVIGLNATMHAVGVLLVAPTLPRLTRRFGTRNLVLAALLASAVLLCLFPAMPTVWLWFPLRILLGVAAEILFVLTETWTAALSTEAIRGRVMAVYTAAMSLGFAGGPAILAVAGTGTEAYLIGAAIPIIALLPLLLPIAKPPPPVEDEPGHPMRFVRLAPIAIGATFLNAAVETAGLSFIPLYAANLGWTEQAGLQLITTLMVGAIVLQLPIGWLIDRFDRERLAILLATLAAVGALFWPWTLALPWLAYGFVFVWGGLFVGIYTVMLTIVGSRFTGSDLVGIYAVMSLAWGLGALVGPTAAGAAMSLSPTLGLPLAIGIGCALFALAALRQRRKG